MPPPADLNDEASVREEARAELDRQAMAQYRRDRENEDSRRRARQGNELVYRRNGPYSYFLDIAQRAIHGTGGLDVEQRLRDHTNQIRLHSEFGEVRGLDETLGAGGSFAAPEYVQSEFQAAAHPLRATADVCKKLTVPANRSQIVIPTFTSGSGDGITTSQNTAITEVDPIDAAVTCITAPISGKVIASRQLVDQASPDSRVDDVISADLGAAYGAQLDSTVLTGSGSGQMTGLLNVPGALTVAAGGTVAGLVDGVVLGYQAVLQNRYRKPNVIIMHPRRWLAGFANSIDLQGRPLMLPSTHPAALMGTPDDGVVAEWLGCKVVLDPNIPTNSGSGNQDFVVVGHSPDWLLYESLPSFNAYPETYAGQMSVLLVAAQYAALLVRYPSSICLVGPYSPPTTPGS